MTTKATESLDEQPAVPPKPAARPGLMKSLRNAFSAWWMPETTSLHERSSNELAEIRTDLAMSRNLMAADRTLMAWIRTALSMYSFGFTIYKLLDAYQRSGADLPDGQTPRTIGLFLTGIGTFAMVMGVVEYWVTIRELRHMKHIPLARPTYIMGVFMAVLGLFLFFSIITKLF